MSRDSTGNGRPPRVAAWIATWWGCGLVPMAPGTVGTLGAVPLAWALARGGQLVFWLGIGAVTLAGIWAADVYVRATQTDDNQQIVVDEVAGYLLTLALVPRTPATLVVAFVLFRVLDVWKPWPVRWLDQNVGGGLGVMVDDLGAGVYGALILLFMVRLGLFAHFSF